MKDRKKLKERSRNRDIETCGDNSPCICP